jgi:hypothetical protein
MVVSFRFRRDEFRGRYGYIPVTHGRVIASDGQNSFGMDLEIGFGVGGGEQ